MPGLIRKLRTIVSRPALSADSRLNSRNVKRRPPANSTVTTVTNVIASHFESAKSALPVPATSTDFVCLVPSCQATMLYLPSGTLSIL
jgi:hypothetical protein